MSSIQTISKYDLTQPFHVYYTLDLINNDTTGTKPLPVLSFNEIRNSPYLGSPENYFMSVIRFSVQTPTLPVFIPQVQLGQANPDLLNYSFTMSFVVGANTIEIQTFVPYINYNFDQPTPDPPLTFQDLTSQYYYVYSYQIWVEMLNNALQQCFTALNTAVVAAGGALPTANPPFLEFDPVALTYNLNADELGYARTLANPIKIFCNSPLQTLISSFQFNRFGNGPTIINGKNFQFVIYNNNDTNILILPTGNYCQMYQEGSTVALMNPIQSIVFSTSLVPVIQENVSVPKVWGSDTTLFNTGNNSNIASILTDFQVPFTPDNRYQPDITYAPTGEYRLIDLYGTSPLSSLDLQVSWKDQFGNTHPLYLGSGCSANLKIMFRRKDFDTASLFRRV